MILIKSVEFKEVEGDFTELITWEGFHRGKLPPNAKAEKLAQYKEIVYGTRFINERGQDVCIGTSLEVQKTIGLCFETFHNQIRKIHKQLQRIMAQKKLIEKLQNKNEEYLNNYNKIANMNFIQRLRFLFTKGENKC